MFFFARQEQENAKALIEQVYAEHADQLVRNIALPVKIVDMITLHGIISKSSIKNGVGELVILDVKGKPLYRAHDYFPKISSMECSSGTTRIPILYEGKTIGALSYCLSLRKQGIEKYIYLGLAMALVAALLIFSILKMITEWQRAEAELLSEIADQVAHDIRSPLAALHTIEECSDDLSAEERFLIRGSISRIQRIADSLLSFSGLRSERQRSQITESISIQELLQESVAEKRLECASRELTEIKIIENYLGNGIQDATHIASDRIIAKSSLRVQAQAVELQRLISNLLNNAIEAIGTNGQVAIELFERDKQIQIKIIDDGCGISAQDLKKLANRGFSSGKRNGFGLGLYHAKKWIHSWGGKIRFESVVGSGTTISIQLPKARDSLASSLRTQPRTA